MRAACHQLRLHPGWQWAGGETSVRRFPSHEFVLQQTFNPVMAKVIKRAFSNCVDCFIHNGTWWLDVPSTGSALFIQSPNHPRILQIYSTSDRLCFTDNYWCKKHNCALLQMGWSTLGKHDGLHTPCTWCSVHSLLPFQHQTLLLG